MATKIDADLSRPDLWGGTMNWNLQLATVNRVARLTAGDETGLARVHRISDAGLEISSIMTLHFGQVARLDLSETVSASATVFARDGKRYCLAFEERVDCAALLRELVAEARTSRARPLRLPTPAMRANGTSSSGIHQLAVMDISQRGMKVRHDGSLQAGLRVCIQLPNGRECRGVVQWVKDGRAGLQLLDILSPDELGSVSRLCAVRLQAADGRGGSNPTSPG